MAILLSQEDIDTRLKELNGWTQEAAHILREFSFPCFRDSIAFVNRVADVAEEVDHHPDIAINYKKVTLSITTHSEGGLTRRDFRLAARIDLL